MTRISNSKIFNLLFIFLFVCTSSCTTIRPINETESRQLANELEIDDVVNVTTKSGDIYKFKIVRVTDEAIYGEEVRIMYEEIDSIDRKEFSAAKTGGLWAGLSVVAVLAGLLAMKVLVNAVFK